ncbi:MAG TPA: 50S ribosomal protein L25/general stress protein Ctc [Actinomyces sp.]|jgi:large subunit ribosomal protein L25|nr:50S ribosomal protein L25/general stress protein Ctc [Actinomyces sp.]
MAEITRMEVTARTEFGKGASRRARRAGLVPAVVYSDAIDPVHVDLPGHEAFLLVKDNVNALVNLAFDGKEQLALVKDIQRHPVRRDILHMDLFAVRRDETVEVEVPLVLTGESVQGTVVNQEHFEILVEAPVIDIPEHLEVSIEGLDEGDVVYASALQMPEGVTHQLDEEEVLASIVVPEEIPEPEEADEDAEAEGEEAEGEEGEEEEAAEGEE